MLGALVMIVTALVVLGSIAGSPAADRLAGRLSPFLQRLAAARPGAGQRICRRSSRSARRCRRRNFRFRCSIAIGHALLVAFILIFGWAAAIAIDIAMTIYLRRFRTDVEDNLLARKHVTQMRILQRVATDIAGDRHHRCGADDL